MTKTANGLQTGDDGLLSVVMDDGWNAEVEREKVLSFLTLDRWGRYANQLLWLVMVFAALTLPEPKWVLAALALRFVIMSIGQFSFSALQTALDSKQSYEKPLRNMAVVAFLSGPSWVLVVLPNYLDPIMHAGRTIIIGGVIVGIGMMIIMSFPIVQLRKAYWAGLILSFGLIAAVAPLPFPSLYFVAAVTILMTLFLMHGLAAAGKEEKAARTIVENRRLNEELAESLAYAEFLANHDALTGLMNRRAFFACADMHGGDKTRHLISIDLDDFKSINDSFGHSVGDQVLVQTAVLFRDMLGELPKEENCAARIGGEEFVIVLSDTSNQQVRDFCEKLRSGIAQIGSKMEVPGLRTTASFGMAKWVADTPIDSALHDSDMALYKAKQEGRNRVSALID